MSERWDQGVIEGRKAERFHVSPSTAREFRKVSFFGEHWPRIGPGQGGMMESEPDLSVDVRALKAMVALQAEDEGLWFDALTAPEAYLQQALRLLHAAVEAVKGKGG